VNTAPVLTGEGLVKRFGTTTALAGVDFQVRRAESVAIMGPSGSGKSTLLHCLAGILRPDEGRVSLDGRRIENLGEADRSVLRRTRFGFVFQFGQLLPELPSVENVALPLMLDGVARRTAVARAASWFGPLGLAGLEQRRPGELSGGQAQRVAIARALICEPAVVFADEPTGSLDQTTGAETLRLLTDSTRKQGACLVMVTHDPTVAAACDRVVEVRDGLIRGGGAPLAVPVRAGAGPAGAPRAEVAHGPEPTVAFSAGRVASGSEPVAVRPGHSAPASGPAGAERPQWPVVPATAVPATAVPATTLPAPAPSGHHNEEGARLW